MGIKQNVNLKSDFKRIHDTLQLFLKIEEEVKDYEGKFLKIIFEGWSSGTFEFQEGDELDLEKPLQIEYGLFSSIPINAVNTNNHFFLLIF